MTQPDPIPPGQDTSSDVEQQSPSPFPDADRFELTKEINYVQLNDELTRALDSSILISVVPTDLNLPISDANPATLHISPSGQDQSKVYSTINAHVPYTAYEVPAADQAYSATVQKVVDNINDDLTSEEMQTAVKGLLLKQNTAQQQSLAQELSGDGIV